MVVDRRFFEFVTAVSVEVDGCELGDAAVDDRFFFGARGLGLAVEKNKKINKK